MAPSVRSVLTTVTRFLRDGWLIVGISVVMIIGLDLMARVALIVRDRQKEASLRNEQHPQGHLAWFADWRRLGWPESLPRDYDPYRAWRMRPVAGSGLTIDRASIRRTVPEPPSGQHTRRVLMLGGSVMWGYSAPDASTIPSLVAQMLTKVPDLGEIGVVNVAQPAYVFTQEVVTLALELRDGRLPAAVVFLDGINDVAAAADLGEPGRVFDEPVLADRMQMGTGRLRRLGSDLAKFSAIVEILTVRLRRVARQNDPVPVSVCSKLADFYWNQVRMIEALSESYGFTTLFVWQPALATTAKALTEWERAIVIDHPVARLLRPCSDVIAGSPRSANFVDLRKVFDTDTKTVFLDQWGHVTEEGNATIASHISSRLVNQLQKREKP